MVVQPPTEESDDDGTVKYCVIQTYGDTTHTLIDKTNYKGHYLPGYRPVTKADPLTNVLYVNSFSTRDEHS